jgi:hypothetical protein
LEVLLVDSAPWFALGLLVVSTALGVLLLTLHQISLILLVTALGERLPLPWIRGLRRATLLAGGLALISLTLALGGLRQALADLLAPEPSTAWGPLVGILALLPWFLIPALMLTTELASSGRDTLPARFHTWWIVLVLGLRWICALCYVLFVLIGFAVSYLHQGADGAILLRRPLALLDSLLFLGYLLVVPGPVLAALSLLGVLQRQVLRLLRTLPSPF